MSTQANTLAAALRKAGASPADTRWREVADLRAAERFTVQVWSSRHSTLTQWNDLPARGNGEDGKPHPYRSLAAAKRVANRVHKSVTVRVIDSTGASVYTREGVAA